MPDHTHILLGLKPDEAPSDLIGRIKTGSTNHINERRWIGCRFSWQEGIRCFFNFPFPPRHRNRLHSQPGKSSSPQIVSARICRIFWSAMMWPTTRYTFLNRMNDPKHAAPNGAFGLLTNDSYRPAAPTELISVICLASSDLRSSTVVTL